MMHYLIGDVGHLFVITSFVTAIVAAFSYYVASKTDDLEKKKGWITNGRTAFIIHGIAVVGIFISLFFIIYNHYFEYHYAWSHSSRHLPGEYMISCFWEGQEGSFLLWMFWEVVLGIILIFSSKKWEAPVMTVFALVQGFLASMILGVVIFNVKIGSSPFILLRDALDAPIFKANPNYIPKDGTGLNPLLQNYWMVIHPPTLFLGFALTLVPFSFAIAGLWKKDYTNWIKPALPWSLVGGGILGLGIIMGGIWAYETLNFGGYWNWDPVENAVYVPWLILVGAIHMMVTYHRNKKGLKAATSLAIATFLMILYSTFLTRSGILGNSSVHSFTDLGLSGQLLLYLFAFVLLSGVLLAMRWKKLPGSTQKMHTTDGEFWVFIGASILCMMAFQVIIPTSIPVWNAIVEGLGGISNVAPPADQVAFYTAWQMWLSLGIALLSGTAQYFWWKKAKKENWKQVLLIPALLSLLLAAVFFVVTEVKEWDYLLFLLATIYGFVTNGVIVVDLIRKNYKLSGGAIAHVGVVVMLIGILFSAGYSKIVSLNTTGMLYSKDLPDEMNKKNLLLFLNDPQEMKEYTLVYKGRYLESPDFPMYVKSSNLAATGDNYKRVVKEDVSYGDDLKLHKGDTIGVYPENTYYRIDYTSKDKSEKFTLFPRAQVNPTMGLLASPDIDHRWNRDLYTHVTSVPDPKQPKEWSELKKMEVKPGERFFVNDYVAEITKIEQLKSVQDVNLKPGDVAVGVHIKVYGKYQDYKLNPIYMIRNNMVGRIPDEQEELGIKIRVLKIDPKAGKFTLGVNTAQKDYVIIKAMEKPLINLLWIGTGIVLLGFGIAIVRRAKEFRISS